MTNPYSEDSPEHLLYEIFGEVPGPDACECGMPTECPPVPTRPKKQTEEPGLHRVGPNPWDFEYNPAKGQRVGFMDLDGTTTYGTITDFTENEESGEINLSVDPDEDPEEPREGR